MGLENILWKRAFNTMEAELRRRGYTTSMSDDPTRDSPERRTIRVVCRDEVVDLYIRARCWTVDKWIKAAGGWHHSNIAEIVQDRWGLLGGGSTNIDARTPHEIVLDTLVYNFVLPEFGPAQAPDPAASRVPGTFPGPAADLPEGSAQTPQQPVFLPSSAEVVEFDHVELGDMEGEDNWYDEEDDEDEPPATAGVSPFQATRNTHAAAPMPEPLGSSQDIVEHFAAGGVHDLSGAMHAPAKLYRHDDDDDDDLPGTVVTAGHLLCFFPKNDVNNSEHEPLVLSLYDLTDIHLNVPEGLALVIPRGIHFNTILSGTLLSVFLPTPRVSLLFDVPSDDDPEQGREQVRWFINGFLARFREIRGI